MIQRIHDSSEGLSGKQDASQPQNTRFYLFFKPNNEHSVELGVCSLYRRQKATAHTQIQLGHAPTSAPVPPQPIHTSLPHCFTILLSFCSLRKSTISVHAEFVGRAFKTSHRRHVLKCCVQRGHFPVPPPHQIPNL